MAPEIKPVVELLDWSKRFIADDSRYRFLVASAQSGKSFTCSLDHVFRRLEQPGLSIFLSASDRQSMELMEKVGMHTRGMGVLMKSDFFEKTSITQHTAEFPNRSRIICLPANPDTARGYSGDVFLDEFAMHRDARSIWGAMMTRATRGYRVDVASTFKGTSSKFYELAKELGLHSGIEPASCPVRVAESEWSGHWVDIYKAKREGMDVNIEQIRRALADEEVFAQEFLCIPMTGGDEFIPLELIVQCESEEATTEFDYVYRPGQVAGRDIGRTHDRTTDWILSPVGDYHLTKGVIVQARTTFTLQDAKRDEVAGCVDRYCIDAKGIGAQQAEQGEEKFPGLVEGIHSDNAIKNRLVINAKRALEERSVRIPARNPAIRRAFQSIKRYISVTGGVRFDAARTAHGHADEFFAFAYALGAASDERNYTPLSECETDDTTQAISAGMMEVVW